MSATTTGLQLSCANSSWRLSTSTNDYVLFTASTDVNTHTINEIQVENIDGSTTSCEMDLSWGAENEGHVIVRQIQSVSNARFVEVYDGDMNYVVTMKGVLLTDGTTRYTTDLSVINLMLNNQRRARLKFVSIKSSQLTITNLTATLLHKPVVAASKAASIPLQTSPPATQDSSSSLNDHNHHNHIVVMAQVEMMTRRFLQEMEGLLDRKLAPVMHKLNALQSQLDSVQAARHVVPQIPTVAMSSSDSCSTAVEQQVLSSPTVEKGENVIAVEVEMLQVDRIAAASSESDGDLELKNDMKSLMMMLRRGGINNDG